MIKGTDIYLDLLKFTKLNKDDIIVNKNSDIELPVERQLIMPQNTNLIKQIRVILFNCANNL